MRHDSMVVRTPAVLGHPISCATSIKSGRMGRRDFLLLFVKILTVHAYKYLLMASGPSFWNLLRILDRRYVRSLLDGQNMAPVEISNEARNITKKLIGQLCNGKTT
ncbi:hypothetical protein HPP92_014187 [Vanilla planifolia]|uniref:Uncharacterized protein n=1 Tax=Vanilla planifolia TaxID=51239 RepID=A0A835QJJ6_VANPL|nr:hypothetical protein HPP92_014187 [Vanilla planifolia]